MASDYYAHFGRPLSEQPTQKRPNFAFVDANNIARDFDTLLKRSKVNSEHYDLLSIERMLAVGGHDRVFLYTGADPLGGAETWLETLEQSDGFVLRTGRLTRKAKQEGVDVKLAIEAVRHATQSNMASCCIYSGDGDFLPLVEMLVDLGIFVTFASFNNPTIGQVAPSLNALADQYIHLSGDLLLDRCLVLRNGFGATHPVNEDQHKSYAFGKTTPTRLPVDDDEFELTTYGGFRFWWRVDDQLWAHQFGDMRQAELWLRIVWPSIVNGEALSST
ncbi:MAG: NYN domain-containing protein [Pseudomonadota bacterium]